MERGCLKVSGLNCSRLEARSVNIYLIWFVFKLTEEQMYLITIFNPDFMYRYFLPCLFFICHLWCHFSFLIYRNYFNCLKDIPCLVFIPVYKFNLDIIFLFDRLYYTWLNHGICLFLILTVNSCYTNILLWFSVFSKLTCCHISELTYWKSKRRNEKHISKLWKAIISAINFRYISSTQKICKFCFLWNAEFAYDKLTHYFLYNNVHCSLI